MSDTFMNMSEKITETIEEPEDHGRKESQKQFFNQLNQMDPKHSSYSKEFDQLWKGDFLFVLNSLEERMTAMRAMLYKQWEKETSAIRKVREPTESTSRRYPYHRSQVLERAFADCQAFDWSSCATVSSLLASSSLIPLHPSIKEERRRTQRIMEVGRGVVARESVLAASEDERAALSVFAGVAQGPGAEYGTSRRLRRVGKGVIGLSKVFLQ